MGALGAWCSTWKTQERCVTASLFGWHHHTVMKHNRATAATPCLSLDTADGEQSADSAVTGVRSVLASRHLHQAQQAGNVC